MFRSFLFSQEFNIEKLQLVEAEKRKIRQEYERKDKQVEVAKKMYAPLPIPFQHATLIRYVS